MPRGKLKKTSLHLVSPELPRKVEACSREEEESLDPISGNPKVIRFDFSTRCWLLPVILRSCWVPMPGCLHIRAQNLLPERSCSDVVKQNNKIKITKKILSKSEEYLTAFCSDVSSKAL